MKKFWKNNYIVDAVIVGLITLVAYFALSAIHIEHTFLFLFPVPIAIFTIKYEDSKAILPLSFILALSAFVLIPLGRFNPIIEGFIVMTITAIIGVLHGYIAERHMSHALRLTLIIIADIVANFLILVVFSPLIFGYTINEEVVHSVHKFFDFIKWLNPSEELINISEHFALNIIPTIVIATGIAEAILTHVIVHALSKRVFKIEYGHTFTGIHILVPRVITIIFVPILILTAIFIPQCATLGGFWGVVLVISLNIVAIGFVFYLLNGYTLTIRFFAYRFHKRAYLLSTILMILLAPLMFLLGIIDSLFKIQPRLVIQLRKK